MALEILATSGESLALQRVRFREQEAEELLWEIDTLQLSEVDASGRLVALVSFDPEDRVEAAWEMLERWSLSPEHQWPWLRTNGLALTRAQRARDPDALRRILPDDFYLLDERRSGLGRLDREAYVASYATVLGQTTAFVPANLHLLAIAEHAALWVSRTFGLDSQGGEFEMVSLRLYRYEGNRLMGIEQFEVDHLERARRRFEELGAAYAAHRRKEASGEVAGGPEGTDG